MADEYKVGYGKPPKATRFKQGRSGNPRGRPTGSKNFATEFSEEMNEKIIVRENGCRQTVSKRRGMVKALTSKALKGDVRALTAAIALERQVHEEKSGVTAEAPLTLDEETLMELLLERAKRQKKTRKEGSDGDK